MGQRTQPASTTENNHFHHALFFHPPHKHLNDTHVYIHTTTATRPREPAKLKMGGSKKPRASSSKAPSVDDDLDSLLKEEAKANKEQNKLRISQGESTYILYIYLCVCVCVCRNGSHHAAVSPCLWLPALSLLPL